MSDALNKIVAEKVMGWRTERRENSDGEEYTVLFDGEGNECDSLYGEHQRVADFDECPIPPYSTDPAADYSVLVKVRETWEADAIGRFVDALAALWHPPSPLMYRVGDYSRAALNALGIEPPGTGA